MNEKTILRQYGRGRRDFRNADLTNAILDNTNLNYADLEGAKITYGNTDVIIKESVYN